VLKSKTCQLPTAELLNMAPTRNIVWVLCLAVT